MIVYVSLADKNRSKDVVFFNWGSYMDICSGGKSQLGTYNFLL